MSTISKLTKHFSTSSDCYWYGTAMDCGTGRTKRGWFYVDGGDRFYQAPSLHEWQCSPFRRQEKKLIGRDTF